MTKLYPIDPKVRAKMAGIVNKDYYASKRQNNSNSFQYIWRGLEGDLYPWALKIESIFFVYR